MKDNLNHQSGKICSICGKWHSSDHYDYANRPNRSYCRVCNNEEKAAYTSGGIEAARQYREDRRASWQTG